MRVEVRGHSPQVAESCFIAPSATLIGQVRIGEHSSIWYNVVARGDVEPIVIGRRCNVQDNSVVHGSYGKCGTTLEDCVTIGHMVVLHGAFVGQNSLIGMGAILMDNSRIGRHSLVGAGSLVTEGSVFEDGSLIMGRPAKRVRALRPDEMARLSQSAEQYLIYMQWYQGDVDL